jgi:hypothetical protein
MFYFNVTIFLIKRKPVYSMTLTISLCIYLHKEKQNKMIQQIVNFYLTLCYNTKYWLTYVGLSIGDPDVRMRGPVVDRWAVNYNYIFSRYHFFIFC